MGEAGRRYVLDNYQWDGILRRYETFLGRVIHETQRRPRRIASR
jgi:hypothetical protein